MKPTFNSETLTELQSLDDDGETGLVIDLLENYIGKSPAMVANIREAASRGDYPELERGAHSMKSSSGMLGLERLSALCRGLEDGAHTRSIPGVALEQVLKEIETESRKAVTELLRYREGLLVGA